MKKILSLILILIFLVACALPLQSCAARKKFSVHSFEYFDTITTVSGYAKSQNEFDEVKATIMSELENYDHLFSIYDQYDGLNNLYSLNEVIDGSHPSLTVDRKIIDLLIYSKQMYQTTQGRVNVAMGSVLSIWHRHRTQAKEETATLPTEDELSAAAEHTDINSILIDESNSTVYISDPEVLLDVGAIAKGYAVEMIAQKLEQSGIDGYMLNVGGNVRTIGRSRKWSCGIENPYGGDTDPYYEILELNGQSLVTSGSYNRFYTVNQKSYHHIIDPDSLMPPDNYISVSVVCESSALADALSTALFLMDTTMGMQLIDTLDDAEAMWVQNDGSVLYSNGFSKYIKN